ncbi:hypothetical protein [Streptomyces sp. NPDC086835]|uniref:hypothetical protein n=1 Tax=Streptomyces sp. NPDC086835 TaxID=3365761 RepID=UPI0037F6BA6D
MSPTDTVLDQVTEALLTEWHRRVEGGIVADPAAHCAALAAAALAQIGRRPDQAASDGTELPPYSGPDTLCPKCSHDQAITRYRAEGEHGTDEHSPFGRSRRGERLERQCWSCDYVWDEALNPPAGDPRLIDVPTLARALQEAHAGWALDLSPECAEHMARQLLGNVVVYRNHVPDEEPAAADVEDGAAA